MISEYAANTDSNERILLYDIWKILDGEIREHITIEDLRVLLMAIMRITDHKRIGVEKPEEIEDVFTDGPSISITDLVASLTRLAPNHSNKWRNINYYIS